MKETKMELADWLDDLCVRFIVNLPREELESVERICFQVEEAQWFYEDFIRPLDPTLPSLGLREFCSLIFQHCPLFSCFDQETHSLAYLKFLAYKTRVPVRGAIMLNESMDAAVLVKGWKKSASWSFPRGKINKDEKDIDCAIREVYEETGYDLRAAGLVLDDVERHYFIEITMREQNMRLYVFPGVPMDTEFEPRTRKEISKIQWYNLSDLPTSKKPKLQQNDELAANAKKFYMVAPFLGPLKRFITRERKRNQNRGLTLPPPAPVNQPVSLPDTISGELGRLVERLRKSQEISKGSDLPEVSVQKNANPTFPNHFTEPLDFAPHLAQTSSGQQTQKATAMLSLLNTDKQTGQTLPSSSLHPLQPPFKKMWGPPHIPPSPKRRVDEYPYNPAQAGNFGYPNSSYRLNENSSAQQSIVSQADHCYEYPAEPGARALRPTQHSTPLVHHDHEYLAQPVARTLGPTQRLAPYHRTGDPQFTPQEPHFPFKTQSAIPPASKLPPPKLNSHSSALLDLFKSKDASRSVAITTNASIMTASIIKANPPSNPPPNEQSLSGPQVLKPAPSLNHDTSGTTRRYPASKTSTSRLADTISHPEIAAKASKSRSEQQNMLLNLFRTPPSAPPSETSSATVTAAPSAKPINSLAPPSAPVELSAQSSPSHSSVPSEINTNTKQAPPKSFKNGSVTIQKRPVAATSPMPVSATVTGPLNVPQFEKVPKKPTAGARGKSQSWTKNKNQASEQPKPVQILSRPGTAGKGSTTNAESNSPKHVGKGFNNLGSVSPKHAKRGSGSSRPQKAAMQPKVSPKPFQPQILKRPVAAQPIESVPAGEKIPTLFSENDYLDDNFRARANGPVTQKIHTLVSGNGFVDDNARVQRKTREVPRVVSENGLGNESARAETKAQSNTMVLVARPNRTILRPSSPPLNTTVSSLGSEKMPSGGTLPSLPGVPSRIDSLDFGPDNGQASRPGTTTSSPVDKQFLLGFLDGIIKEGRR